MKINPKINEILKQYNIHEDSGILYLLSIYHNLDTNVLENLAFESVGKQVNLAKIVERDYTEKGMVTWNVNLYESEKESETAWDWVEEWREMFAKLRPDARGNKKDCLTKMKKFFANNPEIRKDDVIKATQLYLATVRDAKYLQQANYFICKVVKAEGGSTYNSRLEQYLEVLQKQGKSSTVNRAMNQLVR